MDLSWLVLLPVAAFVAYLLGDWSHFGADHKPDWDNDWYSLTAVCRICGRTA